MNDPVESVFEFSDQRSGCSVVLVDDGRVAYAYFLDTQGAIVGDVWLYNRCETPDEPEWTNADNLPLANPAGFAKSHANVSPIDRRSECRVEWDVEEPGKPFAYIFIRDMLWAALANGTKPGWCAMAAKDGPLARTMANAPTPMSH